MFDDLLLANDGYATEFRLSGIAAPAAKGFALLTCMDSRIEPLAMLGLAPGDAKIMRNAGGRVTDDMLRSLILATHFLNVSEIAVMQHTHCAMTSRTEEQVWAEIAAELPDAVDEDRWEFGTMADPDATLAEDVERLRSCPLLPPEVRVEGWRYDVDSGRIARLIAS
jgi:carbonic anhydrase